MKPFKKLSALIVVFFLLNPSVFAQVDAAAKFSKVAIEDFNVKSPLVDAATNGVIIADVGSLEFTGNKFGWFSTVLKVHERKKIINKNAFDLATVIINLYGKGERQDIVDNISAATYNIENGQVIETKLTKPDIFEEQINANKRQKKFTMPAVKEGSIIDYSFTITSFRYHYLPVWDFQNLYYPSLYSEYTVVIPNLLNYIIERRGVDSFYEKKSTEVARHYLTGGADGGNTFSVRSTANSIKWVMKDIPHFKAEDYIKTPNEYLDKLEFHLSQSYNGQDVTNVAKSWKEFADDLLSNGDFGVAVSNDKASNLLSTAEKICGTGNDYVENANKIYDYIRDNFIAVEDNDIYAYHDLYDVNKSRKGNIAEINLLLVALLRQKGIVADPVILSTAGYAINSSQYPISAKLNYVICMTKLKGETVFLDASQPKLAFGKLPLYCYNGHARIIGSERGASIFLLPGDIEDNEMTNAILINNDKDETIGTITHTLGYYSSFDFRKGMSQNTMEKYKKEIVSNNSEEIAIDNISIDSVNVYELPISVQWDARFKVFSKAEMVYFSPLLGTEIKANPFNAAQRLFPVELPFKKNEIFTLNMEVPKGYTVDELPKSARLNFNETEGKFEYLISIEDNYIHLRCNIQFKKATFDATEYQSLRDFYSYIIKKEAEQIVFKKNK